MQSAADAAPSGHVSDDSDGRRAAHLSALPAPASRSGVTAAACPSAGVLFGLRLAHTSPAAAAAAAAAWLLLLLLLLLVLLLPVAKPSAHTGVQRFRALVPAGGRGSPEAQATRTETWRRLPAAALPSVTRTIPNGR